MPDWNRAFRNDYVEPDPLPEAQRLAVASCDVLPLPHLKTWFGCFRDGELLGYVRVKLAGDSWCSVDEPKMDKALYCGEASKLNRFENRYAFAILKLIELHDKIQVK